MRLSDNQPPGSLVSQTRDDALSPSVGRHEDDGESLLPPCPSTRHLLEAYLKTICVDDAEGVAAKLINEFGSLPQMLSGSIWRLRQTVGSHAANAIRSTRNLLEASHLQRAADQPIIRDSEAVLAFLQSHSGYLTHERITALYLAEGLQLLKVQVLAEGHIGYADFSLSTVLRWGLDVGAASFILVHNHPSGDPQPSVGDKQVSARLRRMAEALEMPMLEHIIVAQGRVAYVNMESKG